MDVPDHLCARVASPGDRPAIHGYDVADDLMVHYSFSDVVFLSLTGELPAEPLSELFGVALTAASMTSIAEAPAHAAALSVMCGAKHAGMAATGAIALVEQARSSIARHESFIVWLQSDRASSPPEVARLTAGQASSSHGRQLRARAEAAGMQLGGEPLTAEATLLAVLFDCGLREPEMLQAALAFARWPLVIAEARAAKRSKIGDYPIRTPAFRYDDGRTPM